MEEYTVDLAFYDWCDENFARQLLAGHYMLGYYCTETHKDFTSWEVDRIWNQESSVYIGAGVRQYRSKPLQLIDFNLNVCYGRGGDIH